jgi:hypothetical protein
MATAGEAGFLGLVGMFTLMNGVAIWALPAVAPFEAGLAVAYPIGMAEGFVLYWLIGRLAEA